MKKILSIIFVTALLFNAAKVHAIQQDCTIIGDDSTFNSCCSVGGSGDPNTCVQYRVKSCKVINSNEKYNMCGCIGSTSDTPQCVAYIAANKPSVTEQIGGTAASPATVSTGAINSTSTTGYEGNPAITGSATDPAVKACSAIVFKTLLDYAIWAKCLIGAIVIPGIFTLAFVIFLWGVLKFIRSSEQKDKAESKQFILMGLIGLFVMVSVWGIIKILNTTLNIDSTVPTLQTDYLSPSNASK